MTHPASRRARALRALGIAATVIVAVCAMPFIIVKLFAEAGGNRRA